MLAERVLGVTISRVSVAARDRRHRGQLGRRDHDEVLVGRHAHLHLLDEHLELEVGEHLVQHRQVPLLRAQILERNRQRHVAAQFDQLPRQLHARELLGIAERLLDRDPRHDRVRRDQLVEGVVVREQRRRGLVSDPAQARDVVAGVADEREEVRNLLRRHAHLLDDLVARVRLAVQRVDHRHVIADQLHDVLVGAVHDDLPVALARLDDERRDHVVRFDARHREHRPAHRVDDRREVVHLHGELLGRRLAGGLVLGVHLGAERLLAALVVEHDDDALGRRVLFEPHQHAREHVERAGRHALGCREPHLFALAARDVHQPVVGAEHVAVSVDDVQALGHRARGLWLPMSCGMLRRMYRIVVDAMGGDHAPDEIVQGAAEASLGLAGAEIILVGDAAALGRLLPRMRHDGARVRVHHAPTWIEMDEKPAEALAAKPEASIVVAADLVARGEGDALVSAGNTGASGMA